ncbi:MAG: Zn-dependent hydrolase [Pseudomonadota bacterium]
MAPSDNFRIDRQRLWDSLMEMARIGPGVAGGNNRQALTPEDAEGRRLLASWCEAEGLSMAIDEMGNMFARRAGTEPHLPPVMVGSHLDTQPTGGKYDGVLGVLAALELVRRLNEAEIRTRHPIEIVNWTNEEGSRFAPSMTGSGVFAGIIPRDEAYCIEDAEGVKLGTALEQAGFLGDVPCSPRPIHAFFELHIEQGPLLEKEGLDIGVVTHGQGLRWIEFTLTGKEAHTGSTPMEDRLNAGLGMARIIERVHQIALANAPDGRGTVGHFDVSPNSRNIVAAEAVFTADVRHPDRDTLFAMERMLESDARAVAEELGLELAMKNVGASDPVAFDSACVSAVRAAAERLGLDHRNIVSGAGHDACFIADIAPTAMVFCPCIGGLSHNEAEEITPEWAAAGANVLMHAVLEMAEVV